MTREVKWESCHSCSRHSSPMLFFPLLFLYYFLACLYTNYFSECLLCPSGPWRYGWPALDTLLGARQPRYKVSNARSVTHQTKFQVICITHQRSFVGGTTTHWKLLVAALPFVQITETCLNLNTCVASMQLADPLAWTVRGIHNCYISYTVQSFWM